MLPLLGHALSLSLSSSPVEEVDDGGLERGAHVVLGLDLAALDAVADGVHELQRGLGAEVGGLRRKGGVQG